MRNGQDKNMKYHGHETPKPVSTPTNVFHIRFRHIPFSAEGPKDPVHKCLIVGCGPDQTGGWEWYVAGRYERRYRPLSALDVTLRRTLAEQLQATLGQINHLALIVILDLVV